MIFEGGGLLRDDGGVIGAALDDFSFEGGEAGLEKLEVVAPFDFELGDLLLVEGGTAFRSFRQFAGTFLSELQLTASASESVCVLGLLARLLSFFGEIFDKFKLAGVATVLCAFDGRFGFLK